MARGAQATSSSQIFSHFSFFCVCACMRMCAMFLFSSVNKSPSISQYVMRKMLLLPLLYVLQWFHDRDRKKGRKQYNHTNKKNIHIITVLSIA